MFRAINKHVVMSIFAQSSLFLNDYIQGMKKLISSWLVWECSLVWRKWLTFIRRPQSVSLITHLEIKLEVSLNNDNSIVRRQSIQGFLYYMTCNYGYMQAWCSWKTLMWNQYMHLDTQLWHNQVVVLYP